MKKVIKLKYNAPKRFIIERLDENEDYGHIDDLIIKLTYHQDDPKEPQLNIFENTQVSQLAQWHLTGPSEHKETVYKAKFSKRGDEKIVKIGENQYEIRFINLTQDKSQKIESEALIPVYEFEIKKSKVKSK